MNESTDGRCTAHRTNGQPCHAPAMRGQTVCIKHCGGTPQARGAAGRRLAQAKAIQAVVTYGLPVDIEPQDALIEEVARTAGHVRWLAQLVSEIERADLVWGVTEEQQVRASEFTGVNITKGSVPNVWLDLYQRERTHLVAVCKAAIGAGIAERQVRLAEQQGALIADVIRAVIGDPDLGLSVEQQETARRVASHHLRALPAA